MCDTGANRSTVMSISQCKSYCREHLRPAAMQTPQITTSAKRQICGLAGSEVTLGYADIVDPISGLGMSPTIPWCLHDVNVAKPWSGAVHNRKPGQRHGTKHRWQYCQQWLPFGMAHQSSNVMHTQRLEKWPTRRHTLSVLTRLCQSHSGISATVLEDVTLLPIINGSISPGV